MKETTKITLRNLAMSDQQAEATEGSESRTSVLLYAIYSEKQRDSAGGLFEYERKNGEKVMCTSVGDTPSCSAKFSDVRRLGEVVKYVRTIDEPKSTRSI